MKKMNGPMKFSPLRSFRALGQLTKSFEKVWAFTFNWNQNPTKRGLKQLTTKLSLGPTLALSLRMKVLYPIILALTLAACGTQASNPPKGQNAEMRNQIPEQEYLADGAADCEHNLLKQTYLQSNAFHTYDRERGTFRVAKLKIVIEKNQPKAKVVLQVAPQDEYYADIDWRTAGEVITLPKMGRLHNDGNGFYRIQFVKDASIQGFVLDRDPSETITISRHTSTHQMNPNEYQIECVSRKVSP